MENEKKTVFSIFNIKNKHTASTSTITLDQNVSVPIATANKGCNINIINDDDEPKNTSRSLDLGDLNSGPMRPILKVSTFSKLSELIILVISITHNYRPKLTILCICMFILSVYCMRYNEDIKCRYFK